MSKISRRQFTSSCVVAGGLALVSGLKAAPAFKLRQFHNQPEDSPLHKRLVEMWAAVKTETGGRVDVATFPDNDQLPGSDPAALKMLIDGELDFFTLNGGLIGTVVPAVNVQGIPFAFHNEEQVYRAIDGNLGEYLAKEMASKGIYAVPRACFENGFRQITCSVKPIRTADDLNGIKMRTPDTPIYVECWRALGATPVVFNFNKIYEVLKNKQADAQDNPLNVAELLKLYEVQKYISLTNHIWSGFNLIANLKMWRGLPSDVQQIIQRNAEKYVKLQRDDTDKMNHELAPRLQQRGMMINQPDASSFRSRLGDYYARWKGTIGSEAWALLESHVGKLG
ncbi:MAG TPA: TRAP transporter substrate-binding protein [Candidatus Acidoferrales bacterium]|nr:TRAP transporter substrate-binding protein [Candidatus Acidoferrales bacterium]